MEGVVARALKPSLLTEFAVMKSSTQQVLYEEFMSLKANNVVSCEDFSVDDLLDFSNGEFSVVRGGHNTEQVDDEEEEKDSLFSSTSSQDHVEDDSNSNSSDFSGTNESDSIFACGLAVPTDDLAELEWVSHFVDDCAPELSLLYPVTISEQTTKTGMGASTLGKRRSEVPKVRPELTRGFGFSSRMPVKPRTKRQRSNGTRVWSLSALPPSSCSSRFSSMPSLVFTRTVQNMDLLNRVSEPSVEKQKKKPENGQPGGSMSGGGSQVQRRCSHCQVQKTPQWRAGPLGPKTLCNACGVRFKSGRLFPEYRPACSPTFSSEIHSNSHRKVLEIRKNKETAGPEPGLTQVQMI